MKKVIFLALSSAWFLCGCKTNPQMNHAVFTAAVTLGEQIGVQTHPEAVPFLRLAAPVVCGVANGTNVSAGEIVSQLEKAGITDVKARTIINGSLALFNVIVSGLSTNSSELRLYAQDLCNGLVAGLPPEQAHAKSASLPPHLK